MRTVTTFWARSTVLSWSVITSTTCWLRVVTLPVDETSTNNGDITNSSPYWSRRFTASDHASSIFWNRAFSAESVEVAPGAAGGGAASAGAAGSAAGVCAASAQQQSR